MQATIAQLWIYPIKGCAGTHLSAVQALATGLLHDRCMLIVDASTGRFITQRSHPKMALIRPIVLNHTLTLAMVGHADLTISMVHAGAVKTVTVWSDTLPAIDMGNDAADWLSEIVQTKVRLVRFDETQTRAVKRLTHQTHRFADGYPYLVLSLASLQALNERLLSQGATPIGVDRFRANIIIDGVDAHTEDFSSSMTHASGAVMSLVAPCTRCQVPTINQTTGIANAQHEPTLTLNAYRYDSVEDGVTFGMNAVIDLPLPAREPITLSCGDVLDLALSF